MHEALAKAHFERDAGFFTPSVAARLEMTLHQNAYPVIEATVNYKRPIRFRLTGANWSDEPPSILIMKADGNVWKDPMPGGVFHPGPHSKTGLPFICMRGALEYHTHESHLNDKWETHRNVDGNGLVGILMQIAAAWRKANP